MRDTGYSSDGWASQYGGEKLEILERMSWETVLQQNCQEMPI